MASSRRTATNENISTYDSAGGKDYSNLLLWEADTDIDLVSATQSEVVECYKGAHSNPMSFAGATTNSSYFRILRPASGEGHSGIPKSDGSCVEFHSTGNVFIIFEQYSMVQDVVLKSTSSASGNRHCLALNMPNTYAIGVLAYDSSNSGSGKMLGISSIPGAAANAYIINCLAHNIGDYGIWCDNNGVTYLYNTTSVLNGVYGVRVESGSTCNAKNVASSGNSTNDYSNAGTLNQTTNTSEGASPTYVASGSDNFHLADGDTVCRGNGTDLSADGNFAFDDDIDGETRSFWDIGFDENLTPSGVYLITYIGTVDIDTVSKVSGVDVANITKIGGVTIQ